MIANTMYNSLSLESSKVYSIEDDRFLCHKWETTFIISLFVSDTLGTESHS